MIFKIVSRSGTYSPIILLWILKLLLYIKTNFSKNAELISRGLSQGNRVTWGMLG